MKDSIHYNGKNRFGNRLGDLLNIFSGDILEASSNNLSKFENALQSVYNDYDIYFIPKLPISLTYDDFATFSYKRSALNIVNGIFGINDWAEWKTFDELSGSKHYYSNIQYHPFNGYDYFGSYMHIDIDKHDWVNSLITLQYQSYLWYKDFDFSKNHWSRAQCLFIGKNNEWRLHPGRVRMSYPQFKETTTSLFMVLPKGKKLSNEYHETAISVKSLDDINTVRSLVMKFCNLEDIEFHIRKQVDGSIQIWYTENVHDKNVKSEMLNIYFGKELTIEFKDNMLYYNGEVSAFIKDDMYYFPETRPKFKI